MGFEEMQVRIVPPRADVVAAVTGSEKSRLKLRLLFSPVGAERLGVAIGSRYRVLIGTGPDAGNLRLERRDDANCQVIRIGKGGIVLGCGHHPSFDVPRSAEACPDAVVGNRGTIEVRLPDPWPRNAFSRPAGRAAQKPKPDGGAAAAGRPAVVEHGGVTVSLDKGRESFTCNGKTVMLTAQEAIIVHALAQQFGKTVSPAVLVEQLWVGRSVRQAAGELDTLMGTVNAKLRTAGINAFNGGFGWILMAAKATRAMAGARSIAS